MNSVDLLLSDFIGEERSKRKDFFLGCLWSGRIESIVQDLSKSHQDISILKTRLLERLSLYKDTILKEDGYDYQLLVEKMNSLGDSIHDNLPDILNFVTGKIVYTGKNNAGLLNLNLILTKGTGKIECMNRFLEPFLDDSWKNSIKSCKRYLGKLSNISNFFDNYDIYYGISSNNPYFHARIADRSATAMFMLLTEILLAKSYRNDIVPVEWKQRADSWRKYFRISVCISAAMSLDGDGKLLGVKDIDLKYSTLRDEDRFSLFGISNDNYENLKPKLDRMLPVRSSDNYEDLANDINSSLLSLNMAWGLKPLIPEPISDNLQFDFVDLDVFHQQLMDSKIPVVFYGSYGSGKTQFLLKYTEIYRNYYENGIFYISGTTSDQIQTDLLKHASFLFPDKEKSTELKCRDMIEKINKYENSLIIFDNDANDWQIDIEITQIMKEISKISMGNKFIIVSTDQISSDKVFNIAFVKMRDDIVKNIIEKKLHSLDYNESVELSKQVARAISGNALCLDIFSGLISNAGAQYLKSRVGTIDPTMNLPEVISMTLKWIENYNPICFQLVCLIAQYKNRDIPIAWLIGSVECFPHEIQYQLLQLSESWNDAVIVSQDLNLIKVVTTDNIPSFRKSFRMNKTIKYYIGQKKPNFKKYYIQSISKIIDLYTEKYDFGNPIWINVHIEAFEIINNFRDMSNNNDTIKNILNFLCRYCSHNNDFNQIGILMPDHYMYLDDEIKFLYAQALHMTYRNTEAIEVIDKVHTDSIDLQIEFYMLLAKIYRAMYSSEKEVDKKKEYEKLCLTKIRSAFNVYESAAVKNSLIKTKILLLSALSNAEFDNHVPELEILLKEECQKIDFKKIDKTTADSYSRLILENATILSQVNEIGSIAKTHTWILQALDIIVLNFGDGPRRSIAFAYGRLAEIYHKLGNQSAMEYYDLALEKFESIETKEGELYKAFYQAKEDFIAEYGEN